MSTALLYQHTNGRYAVAASAEAATFARNDPRWNRVGPVDISALGLTEDQLINVDRAVAVGKDSGRLLRDADRRDLEAQLTQGGAL